MDSIEIILLSISVTSFTLYFLLPERKEDENEIDIPHPSIQEVVNLERSKQKDRLPIPTRAVVEMIIEWCRNNIQVSNPKIPVPHIKIHRTGHSVHHGWYHSSSNTIVIHLRNHRKLKDLVDTVIHEYIHHIQLRSPADQWRYDALTKRNGYFSNPFEIEARNLAAKYSKKCIKDLKLKNCCRETLFGARV